MPGQEIHFLTLTVVDWLDVFTRPEFAQTVMDSLTFCTQKKGLNLNAWVMMTNHLHILSSAATGFEMGAIIRDFKKFTSRSILDMLRDKTVNESRARAFLHAFSWQGQRNNRNGDYQFWQQENHAVHAYSRSFTEQKLAYIHDNPVRAGYVDVAWHWRYSSARDYMTALPGLVPVTLLD